MGINGRMDREVEAPGTGVGFAEPALTAGRGSGAPHASLKCEEHEGGDLTIPWEQERY